MGRVFTLPLLLLSALLLLVEDGSDPTTELLSFDELVSGACFYNVKNVCTRKCYKNVCYAYVLAVGLSNL